MVNKIFTTPPNGIVFFLPLSALFTRINIYLKLCILREKRHRLREIYLSLTPPLFYNSATKSSEKCGRNYAGKQANFTHSVSLTKRSLLPMHLFIALNIYLFNYLSICNVINSSDFWFIYCLHSQSSISARLHIIRAINSRWK